MDLSIWHCQALYIMYSHDLAEVARIAKLPLPLLQKTSEEEEWEWKRDKYHSFPEEDKNNLNKLKLVLGDFQKYPDRNKFVETILTKLKKKHEREEKEKNILNKFELELINKGLPKEYAEDFVKRVIKEYVDNQALNNIVDSVEMSVQDKIDLINIGYKMFPNKVIY